MIVGIPWERVGRDLIWRHLQSKPGNYYILTNVDYVTKRADAFPILNGEAPTVGRILVEEVFPRYGIHLQIIGDQGNELDNNLIYKGVFAVMGANKIRTSPYKDTNNGAYKCLHRNLSAMLGRVVSESQRDWNMRVLMVMSPIEQAGMKLLGTLPTVLFMLENYGPPSIWYSGSLMKEKMPTLTN